MKMRRFQIEYFLAVVDHGGVNAAAAALDIGQPAVSHAIRGLERELGVPLFHRVGRGMVLSSAGHALAGPARRVMRDLTWAEGAVAPDDQVHGRLDLAVATTLPAGTLAELVSAAREAAPRIKFRISNLRDEETAPRLIQEGHCEIAMCHLPVDVDGRLEAVEIGQQEWFAVFPPGAELPTGDSLPLALMPDVPFVIPPKGTPRAREIESALAQVGRAVRASTILHHREARLSYVLAGLGAAFLDGPTSIVAADRGAAVRRIAPRLTSTTGLVFDPTRLSPAGQIFLEVASQK